MRPDGFHHHHKLRVRFAETDGQAVVYNANFLVYTETARTEYFRELSGGSGGEDHDWRRPRDWDTALAHASLDFRAPARFDDELTVWTRVAHMGTSSFTFEYKIYRGDTLICEAKTVQVSVDRETRKSKPLPSEFKQALAAFEVELARRG
jgi:acyl-CoA thioester hydrolase